MRRILIYSIFLIFVFSCKEEKKEKFDPFKGMTKEERKRAMEDALARSVEKEQEQIRDFIKRNSLNCIQTGTGVHYQIIEKGNGSKPKEGQTINIEYQVFLFNGDTVYSTIGNPDKMIVEYDNKESGLHEAVQFLEEGSTSIIIIPSYRAHGLLGDDKKIPPLSTVVYKLKLVSING